MHSFLSHQLSQFHHSRFSLYTAPNTLSALFGPITTRPLCIPGPCVLKDELTERYARKLLCKMLRIPFLWSEYFMTAAHTYFSTFVTFDTSAVLSYVNGGGALASHVTVTLPRDEI